MYAPKMQKLAAAIMDKVGPAYGWQTRFDALLNKKPGYTFMVLSGGIKRPRTPVLDAVAHALAWTPEYTHWIFDITPQRKNQLLNIYRCSWVGCNAGIKWTALTQEGQTMKHKKSEMSAVFIQDDSFMPLFNKRSLVEIERADVPQKNDWVLVDEGNNTLCFAEVKAIKGNVFTLKNLLTKKTTCRGSITGVVRGLWCWRAFPDGKK